VSAVGATHVHLLCEYTMVQSQATDQQTPAHLGTERALVYKALAPTRRAERHQCLVPLSELSKTDGGLGEVKATLLCAKPDFSHQLAIFFKLMITISNNLLVLHEPTKTLPSPMRLEAPTADDYPTTDQTRRTCPRVHNKHHG